MNMYILVEGSKTEAVLYPSWISHCLPRYQQWSLPEEARAGGDGFYLISGYGYPSIYAHLKNAVATINACGTYDIFIVSLDAEENSFRERYEEVRARIAAFPPASPCRPFIVVQDCCIETWLLANNTDITNVSEGDAAPFFAWYDVTRDDPEDMPAPEEYSVRAKYHEKYLRSALTACTGRGFQKGRPGRCARKEYWSHMRLRLETMGDQLFSLRRFARFLDNPMEYMEQDDVILAQRFGRQSS